MKKTRLLFSKADSKVYALAIPTNEELAIARQTYKIAVAGKNDSADANNLLKK